MNDRTGHPRGLDNRPSHLRARLSSRRLFFAACAALASTLGPSLGLGLGLALGLGGCVRQPEATLRIGTNVWIGSEPLYLARDLGQLDPKTVRLVEYPSASDALRAFRNQAIDGMVISLDELFGLAVDGLRPRVILVADVSHGADVIVGRSGMKTLHDLVGRRIAVETGALGGFVLSRALAINGMRPSDVEVVHLDSNEQPYAFEKGQVDGAVTFDPFRTRLLRAGASVLFDSTQIPGEVVDVVAVRASMLDERPEAVRALIAGWFAATDYLARNPADAGRRMGVRQQTSGEEFLAALGGLRIPSREETLRMIGGTTPELLTSGRRLMAVMLEAKLLRASFPIEEVFAPGPLSGMPP